MKDIKINPLLGFGTVAAAFFWCAKSAGGLIFLTVEVYISGFYGYTAPSNYDRKPELSGFFFGD